MMTLQQAFAWIAPRMPQARLVGDAATPVGRVHTDTRTLVAGDLFVALQGERYDANQFLPQAHAAGAVAAIAHGGLAQAGLSGIEVPDSLEALGQKAQTILADFHQKNPLRMGMRREELRSALLPGQAAEDGDQVVDALLFRRAFVPGGPGFALPDFVITLSPKQQSLKDALLKRFEEARFSPPEKPALLADNIKEKEFPRVLDHLLDQGILQAVSPDIFFLSQDLDQAWQSFHELANQKEEVTLADFRDALNTSRKYALAILELWDRRGLTRKVGEGRRLA